MASVASAEEEEQDHDRADDRRHDGDHIEQRDHYR